MLPKSIERATDRTRARTKARTRARNDSRTLFYTYWELMYNSKFNPASRVAVASRSVRF